MASSGWRTNSTLRRFVIEQYGRFNVHQLVRLLQWKRESANENTSAASWDVGRRFRFRADLSSAFPGREISRLSLVRPPHLKRSMLRRNIEAPEVIEIRTPNYCVASEVGPLPEPFTEWVRTQEKAREHAMPHFLDLFNQRLNVLRFQMKSHQTLALNNLPPAQTPHAHYLASLMGLGQPELLAQMQEPLPPRAWLGLAGLLSNCRKSAPVIAHVLTLFVGARVSLTELVGAWQNIENEDRIALGRRNHRLGKQSVLGRRVWDQQARIRLEVAPLDYTRFCALLPPNLIERAGGQVPAGSHFGGFLALLRLLLDRLHDCEVVLQVRSNTVPPAALTAGADAAYHGLRLGQTAWLQRLGEQDSAQNVRRISYLIPAYDSDLTEAA